MMESDGRLAVQRHMLQSRCNAQIAKMHLHKLVGRIASISAVMLKFMHSVYRMRYEACGHAEGLMRTQELVQVRGRRRLGLNPAQVSQLRCRRPAKTGRLNVASCQACKCRVRPSRGHAGHN